LNYSVRTLSQLRPILQGFRKSAGLTQAVVAARLGVTQQTYAQLEANPAAVSVERLFKALRVLGVDLALTSADAPTETKPKERAKTAAKRPARKQPASAKKSREDW
jgi:HTH-type transcriptional regulator / antitoxin HipB